MPTPQKMERGNSRYPIVAQGKAKKNYWGLGACAARFTYDVRLEVNDHSTRFVYSGVFSAEKHIIQRRQEFEESTHAESNDDSRAAGKT